MIAFATLFIGLILGPQTVGLTVGDGVAAVLIRVDGEDFGMLRGAPWGFQYDFGQDLKPRRLEVVAYDAAGEETGRAVQFLNLPSPPALASVALDPYEPGKPRAAHLAWESVARARPRKVSATFDGRPIPVEDPHEILLPPHDLMSLHFFRAELDFDKDAKSQVEITFGGTYADEVSTELTAIPIELADGRREPPRLEELRGLFRKGDEVLEVVAVEHGEAEVVVVRDKTFIVGLESSPNIVRRSVPIPEGVTFRLLSPVPMQQKGTRAIYNLFPTSTGFDSGKGGLYLFLTRMTADDGRHRQEERLNDAVAVAGLAAYERRRRRAVVLVVQDEVYERAPQQLVPAQSRRFLEHLKVPFFVWTPSRKPAEEALAWGDPVDISSMKKLGAAAGEVYEALDRQWIVWLAGTHLPQKVTLAPEADGRFVLP